MDRRKFLKAAALAGAAFTIKDSGATTLMSQNLNSQKSSGAGNYDLVAVMGGEPAAMCRRALAEMGGIGKFVSKGQKVAIKPNIGWDKAPEFAANTNPELVGELVKQCLAAGASEVVIFDHTCDNWRKCYENSGIEAAAKAAGARMAPADQESYYKPVTLSKGKILKSTKIHEAILNADVWINVPVLKNHGGANMSISMKNLMGIVWDRKFFHANNLQQCIADISSLSKKPVLNVVDAYRLLKTNGPRGRSEADVVLSKGLFMSQDMVAIDTAATNFFNQVRKMPLEDVSHIANAAALKVGTMQLDKLRIKRVKI